MKKILIALMVLIATFALAEGGLTIQKHSEYGDYLADATNKTLYIFKNDVKDSGASTCYDACIAAWPAYLVDSADYKSELAGNFSVITRTNDTYQLAYDGLPLYYFAGDPNAGDVNGQGVGEVWYIASYKAEAY